MIVLTDVAAKLQEILNSENCPTDFLFVVKSQGYHLDSIADAQKGINRIPVFLTMVGGEYNPVPNLHQANFTYGVDIWFPVRFKETFYNINEYLEEVFVGKKLVIGGKTCLCNIGVAEYGEIVGVHLDQFEEWVEDTYSGSVHLFKQEHDISEEYMNMKFNIFATVLGDGFMFGNDVKYTLSFSYPTTTVTQILLESTINLTASRSSSNDLTISGKTWYAWSYVFSMQTYIVYTETTDLFELNNSKAYRYQDSKFVDTGYNVVPYQMTEGTLIKKTEQLVWDSSGTGASISPVSEQLIGVDKYVRNVSNITNFNKSIVVYPKDNDFWIAFLYYYNKQELDKIKSISLSKVYTIGGIERTYTFKQLVLSLNENVELGSPLSFTIAFGDGE